MQSVVSILTLHSIWHVNVDVFFVGTAAVAASVAIPGLRQRIEEPRKHGIAARNAGTGVGRLLR